MKNKVKKSDLGFFNAFTLILIVFMPAFFALKHLSYNASDLLKKAELINKDTLRSEINDFAESLIPANFIERSMESMEKEFGFRTNLISEEGKDSGLYNQVVFAKMLDFMQTRFSLKPVFMVCFEHDVQKIHSFYSNDLANRSSDEKAFLESAITGNVVIEVMRKKLWETDIVRQRLSKLKIGEISVLNQKLEVTEGVLRRFFSPVAYIPKVQGTCHEIFTNGFGSQKLYFYSNGTMQGKHILGGYFVAFASRDLSPQTILKLACKEEREAFKRGVVKSPVNIDQQFVVEKDRTSLFRHLPESFQIQTSQNFLRLTFSDLNRYWLRVSSINSQANLNLKWYFILSSLAQKLLVLFAVALASNFYLFGFRILGKLRKKILLISGLIILLPYILVGYFSGLILDSIEKIRPREVQTAAECKIYEVSQFISDLLLRRQLVVLTAKKRITNLMWEQPKEIFAVSAKKLVPSTLKEEIPLFLQDGGLRVLSRSNEEALAPQKIARFMGYKYIDSLGILKAGSEKVKRELELASLASGFLSGLRKNYLEGDALGYEATYIRDISKMEGLSRMSYFLIPTTLKSLQPVTGLGFIFFSDLARFGDSLSLISYDYQSFLNEKGEFVNHDFAIGRRDSGGELKLWWPEVLTAEKREKRLLQYAARKNFSGSETRQSGQKIQTYIWKFVADDPHLFAGVTESVPDLWIIFLFHLLPFVCGAFTLMSLFLLADFLWELFVRPVKDFIPALNQISRGDYNTHIHIEKTDELGILADSFNAMVEGLRQKEKMSRFVSEKLIENVALSTSSDSSRSEEMELSVLMSDIRGFTSLSEKNSPEEIVSFLNDYFTEMEEAIKEFGGSVERFIGDAIVAVFYQDRVDENHAQRAVKAAISMRTRLNELNASRCQNSRFVAENGIGIVTDIALSGVTGAKSGRQVFMVIGSIVPRAGKLEALTASLSGNKIAVCPKTAALASKQQFGAIPGCLDAFMLVEKDD